MAKKAASHPANPFEARRKAFETAVLEDSRSREALAVVFSGQEQHLTRFFPDPNFYYLTGVSSPGAAVVLHAAAAKCSWTLLLPAPDPASERWTGKVLSSGGLTEEVEPDALRKAAMDQTGFASVGPAHQLADYILKPLRSARILYLSLPQDAVHGPIGQVQIYAEEMRRRHPAMEIRDASPILGDLRRVKDAPEVAAMRQAIALTDKAQEVLLRHLKPGMMEYQIQALVEYVYRSHGAEGTAFPTIVGSGPLSCILHYDRNARPTERGDLVVCDTGARCGLYCADVTRTYPVSGRFTDRQREIYEVVLEANRAAIEAAKPGVLVKDVHAAASSVIDKRGLSRYFFHGTSHYLGLQAHDSGSYDQPLEAGCVITVEPGVYIAAEGIGVRIEDDVLITRKGCEVLSSTPKEPGEIERLLGRPRRTIVP